MSQVTVRKVKDEWVAKAKAEAAARGVSMNSLFVELIRERFGESKTSNGLEKFAGTQPEGFGSEFDQAMEECSQIEASEW